MAAPIKLAEVLAARDRLHEARRLLRVASSELFDEIDSLLSVAEIEIDRVIAALRREPR